MKNSITLFQEIISKVFYPEDVEERKSIAFDVLDHFFSLSRTQIMAGKPVEIGIETEKKIENVISRLNAGEPVQYITGRAYFLGREFIVNRNVLIPRPETEEVVMELLKHINRRTASLRLLDVGTGTGCIPITLKLNTVHAEVHAVDVSSEALAVARDNAIFHKAEITFHHIDILLDDLNLQDVDAVISNPPYISKSESVTMEKNVVNFEPHLALFVPDADPLVFYRTIAEKSRTWLKPEGLLIFEINERFGQEVKGLLLNNGFTDVHVLQDTSGKDRIIKALRK